MEWKQWNSAESKFDASFELEPTYKKPWWFVSIEVASPILDVHGVDKLVKIWHPNYQEPIRVPVQIKGNREDAARYHLYHPEAGPAQLVLLVVTIKHSTKEVLDNFFDRLELIRRLSDVDYEPYLKRLATKPLTPRQVQLVGLISEQRKRAALAAQHAQAAE